MLEHKIEQRRRTVEELKLKGYKQWQIAEKLDVSEQTITADVKFLNARYKQHVTENPQYLERRIEKILEWLDKYELIIKHLYDLRDGNLVADKSILSIVDRFLPEIETSGEQKLEQENKRRLLKQQLNTIAKNNTTNHINILREIRQTLSEQAKILQLISGNRTYIQQNNYIHLSKINLIFDKVNFLIQKFIPENDRKEAYQILKNIDLESQ